MCSLVLRLLDVLVPTKATRVMNKSFLDSYPMRCSTLWSAMDLDFSLLKRGWRGGGDILVVDLCPRTSSLRRWSLQHRSGAWEDFQGRMQAIGCVSVTRRW